MAKTVTLYLLDGEDATRRVKCTISNWTGIAYKVPKKDLTLCNIGGDDCSKHLKQSGIYFLFGDDPKSGEEGVYVGQAGARANGKGLLGRVLESHPTINWTDAVMFARKDDSFGSTEISYLENQFYWLASKGRYKVLNGNVPNKGNIREELKSELDEFIDYAKIVMCFLGHNAFEVVPQKPKPTPVILPPNDGLSLHMKYGKGEADGKYYSSDKFVVLKGSKINPNTTRTCRDSTIRQREDNAEKIRNYKLIADITFKSSSAAASFVAGADLSGKMHWRDADGRTLGELLDGKVTPKPLPEPEPEPMPVIEKFFFMKSRGCDAKGKWTGDKFIVLAGSKINPKPTDRCTDSILRARKKFAKKINGDKLIADVPFKSPSGASGFVCGGSSNGKTAWCDADGRTFAEFEKNGDEEIVAPRQPSPLNGIPLHMEYKGYKAKGTYVGKREFIIHAGSEICPTETPTCPDRVRKLRRKHVGKIKNDVLTSDIEVTSPSTAAGFVCGASKNGYTAWQNKAKVPLGKLLKD